MSQNIQTYHPPPAYDGMGEAVFMRCRKKRGGLIAWLAVIAGALILAILVLPKWFWWLICGAALLIGGLLLMKK